MSEPAASPPLHLAGEEDRLLACVHCGFCLSSCPTYTRLGNEADSPRGRIVLMRAVVEGRLDPGAESFRTHIDQCLGCRSCEPVCPSGVQYGFLVERARADAVDANGQNILARLLLATYGSRIGAAVAGALGRGLRAGGFAAMLARMLPRQLGGARLGLAMLAATRPDAIAQRSRSATRTAPNMLGQEASIASGSEARAHADPHALEGGYPAGTSIPPTSHTTKHTNHQHSVAMLRGCVQHSLLSHVNSDTRDVLMDAGCKLVDAERQGCCGALHAHSGELDHALELARRNIDAFEDSGADIVVVNAAGCGAMMKEYGEQLAKDPQYAARAHAFSARVRDINEYLVELDYQPRGTVAMRVTYDAPCHLHHAQRITRAPIELLQRVHGLTLLRLQRPEECCGGAGIYGITHPDIGGRIMKDKIDDVVASGAGAVLTPNPGCMMQIGAGLILRGANISVLHPIEILAMSARSARQKEQP